MSGFIANTKYVSAVLGGLFGLGLAAVLLMWLVIIAVPVHAASYIVTENPESTPEPPCLPLARELNSIAINGGEIALLTSAELNYARGLYSATPSTPMGIPRGNAAISVNFHRADGSVKIAFIAGQTICTIFTINKYLFELFPKLGQREGDPS